MFLMLCSFNPLRPRIAHYDFTSPNGKRTQRVTMDAILNRAEKRAQQLEHYDDNFDDNYEDYEDFDSNEAASWEREYYDDYEHYRRRGANNATARNKALEMLYKRRGNRGRAFAQKRLGVKGSTRSLTGTNIHTGAAATFNVNITRNSFNIPFALPVQLFNAIDTFSTSAIVKKYLPANVALSGVNINGTSGNVTYTFVAPGPISDTITIACNEVPYSKFLYASITDLLRVGRVLYKISNETIQTQFDQQFTVVEQGMYGFAKENPITLSNFINPSDYRKDSIVVNTAFDIDKQTGIVVGMTNQNVALAANTLSLGMSVTIFDQWTRNKLK